MKTGAHLRKDKLQETMKAWRFTTSQIFLTSPKRWRTTALKPNVVSDLNAVPHPVFVHSTYLLNPASPNPDVRENTVKSLQEQLDQVALVGAEGLIVHAGQGGAGSTMQESIDRWVETLKQVKPSAKIIIENTAGGKSAPGRKLEDFAKLLDAVSFFPVGYCVDTCHSWAGDFGLVDLNSRLMSEIGYGPDVVHLNGSEDEAGCGRDHHANFVAGSTQTELSFVFAIEASAPVILETPGDNFAGDVALMSERLNQ